ncbi:MAG: hypothetical protein ACTSRS_12500 [Candidatus Helarchaeota archaeon]
MNKCERFQKVSFIRAIYKQQENTEKLRLLSSFEGLNQMLGDGFEPSFFYLLYGDLRIANTILLSLAVAAQMPQPVGIDTAVVFIDNDNIFNPYTLIRYALTTKMNPTAVLARISVARAFIWNHLGEIVANLERRLEDQNARLVLVSGLTTLFEGEFERKKQQMLLKIVTTLRNLATDKNLLVIAATGLAEGSAYKPAGGKILSHAAHVLVRVLRQGRRITFDLLKHPARPAGQMIHWLSSPRKKQVGVSLDRFLKSSQGG